MAIPRRAFLLPVLITFLVIALVNTVISLYYYLLIVKAMYIIKNDEPVATFKSDSYSRIGIVICTLGVVLGGIISCIYGFIDTFSYGL